MKIEITYQQFLYLRELLQKSTPKIYSIDERIKNDLLITFQHEEEYNQKELSPEIELRILCEKLSKTGTQKDLKKYLSARKYYIK